MRRNHFKRLTAALLTVILPAALASCSGAGPAADRPAYSKEEKPPALEAGIVAQNDSWQLRWDADNFCVLLESATEPGRGWGTVPYDLYRDRQEEISYSEGIMNSPIVLEYYYEGEQAVQKAYALDEVFYSGRTGSRAIENGVSITYYFDTALIAVTVDYVLAEDGLRVTVDPAAIQDGHTNKDGKVSLAYRVSIAPMMCVAPVSAKDAYLFIPSGSGALMYPEVRAGGADVRQFQGEVYGRDSAVDLFEKTKNEEPIRLPVFGVKNGNEGLCAIIESGAGRSRINAEAGDTLWGYSYAYASFYVHGYNEPVIKNGNNLDESFLYTTKEIPVEPVTVGYYPLQGEKANYTGMAERYRTFLQGRYGLQRQEADVLLHARLIGAYESDVLTLGIPHKKVRAATTYEQAGDIAAALRDLSGGSLRLEMTGFGSTGVDAGKIGGGFTLTGAPGNKKALNGFIDGCRQGGIEPYFDFDLLRYKKSGGGFSTFSDAAVTANTAKIKQYSYEMGTKLRIMDSFSYLLGRARWGEAVGKAAETAKNAGLKGLSLAALGQTAYSDYGSAEYALRQGIGEQVSGFFRAAEKNGLSVMTSAANDYAASAAGFIADVPTLSNRNNGLDKEVPFYQIVFKGYAGMAVTSLNLAQDADIQLLKAVETGSALSFTLAGTYNQDMRDNPAGIFHATLYEDNRARMQRAVERSKGVLEAVAGAGIASHTLIGEDGACTVFDNGVRVTVNYGASPMESADGAVPARGFLAVKQGGEVIA